jgi:uncharacterized membrane-anchored protein YitT (DUF2179 family)
MPWRYIPSDSGYKWLTYALDVILVLAGALMGALSVIVFMAPSNIAPGGVSGAAIILNSLLGTPIGLMIFLLNIPILFIGSRMLGGRNVITGTIIAVVSMSLFIEVLTPYVPEDGVSENILLNAIFGGILGGISGGFIFRAGATAGGTATLGRILQQKFGIPIASATLYTDSLVVLAAGAVFGWEAAMYAIVALFTYGAVADYVLEGPSVIRTVTIITNKPRDVSTLLINELRRGVTAWPGQGMYTGHQNTVLFVTIIRSQVGTLRQLVASVDPDAFIVIGQGHVAYGKGFKRVSGPIRRAPGLKAGPVALPPDVETPSAESQSPPTSTEPEA